MRELFRHTLFQEKSASVTHEKANGKFVSSPEAFLFGLRARGVKPGLAPTRAALDAIGAPDRRMVVIQVAGSVGKGSTAAMIASMLRSAGLSTALFTSPHLVRFTERFVVNGVEASLEWLAESLATLRAAVPWAAHAEIAPPGSDARPLTFFEWATVLACFMFEEAEVDVAVMEAGLGGRWDATTACDVDVTAISRIDLEHTDILGNTLQEIAKEKAGVLKTGVPSVTAPQQPEVLEILKRRAMEVRSSLLVVGEDVLVRPLVDEARFDYRSPSLSYEGLRTRLLGRHQIENAALAIATLEQLSPRLSSLRQSLPDAVEAGLEKARFPGRLEEVAPGLWLDGSHTRASMKALTDFIRHELPGGRAHVVFAALLGKPAGVLLELLRPVASSVILTSAGGDRAMDPRTLVSTVSGWGIPWSVTPDPIRAVETARAKATDASVVVCGSLYLVGALKAALGCTRQDPGDPATGTDARTVDSPLHPGPGFIDR